MLILLSLAIVVVCFAIIFNFAIIPAVRFLFDLIAGEEFVVTVEGWLAFLLSIPVTLLTFGALWRFVIAPRLKSVKKSVKETLEEIQDADLVNRAWIRRLSESEKQIRLEIDFLNKMTDISSSTDKTVHDVLNGMMDSHQMTLKAVIAVATRLDKRLKQLEDKLGD